MSDPTPPPDDPLVPRLKPADQPSGEELPPLPDGGLSSAMPTWLQQAPSRPARPSAPETVDVTSLTAGVEVPEWLQELSRRVDGVVTPAEPPPTPAELIEEVALDLGEPEVATMEAARESASPVQDVESPMSADLSPPSVSADEAATERQPPRTFQVRSWERSIEEWGVSGRSTASAGLGHAGSPQGAPLQQSGVGEGTSPSRGHQPVAGTSERRPLQATTPEPHRSIVATALLLLLLIALAAAGIWYYWL